MLHQFDKGFAIRHAILLRPGEERAPRDRPQGLAHGPLAAQIVQRR
jgi:hypothetical protein